MKNVFFPLCVYEFQVQLLVAIRDVKGEQESTSALELMDTCETPDAFEQLGAERLTAQKERGYGEILQSVQYFIISFSLWTIHIE